MFGTVLRMKRSLETLCKRYEKNPILTKDDIPFPCTSVFNAGVVKFRGEYVFLLRVEKPSGISCLVLAKSKDGYNIEVEDREIVFENNEEIFTTYESKGLEDPRITQLGDAYYILYTAYSDVGPRLSLAKTENFKTFEKLALVSHPQNKDAVLFPEKINDFYVRLDRPMYGNLSSMWISYSKDLLGWYNSKVVMSPRLGYWDSERVGACLVPLKTDHGWIEIYHGARITASNKIYRLGIVVLDLKDPSKILYRSDESLLSPLKDYERIGNVNNVVFSCGGVIEENGELKIYYGGADTCLCLATVNIDDLLSYML